ncbi:hypothetical protein EJB05_14132 [Eragrostis curvula]|uniref:Uncharacterized protein n=1 Tax=Eragrostis curvula TaxID=38414 RepID=A0A5J9VY88_9POAL|nr:hypothetical protein EJB05_14132 [Eragrostis curvula]
MCGPRVLRHARRAGRLRRFPRHRRFPLLPFASVPPVSAVFSSPARFRRRRRGSSSREAARKGYPSRHRATATSVSREGGVDAVRAAAAGRDRCGAGGDGRTDGNCHKASGAPPCSRRSASPSGPGYAGATPSAAAAWAGGSALPDLPVLDAEAAGGDACFSAAWVTGGMRGRLLSYRPRPLCCHVQPTLTLVALGEVAMAQELWPVEARRLHLVPLLSLVPSHDTCKRCIHSSRFESSSVSASHTSDSVLSQRSMFTQDVETEKRKMNNGVIHGVRLLLL